MEAVRSMEERLLLINLQPANHETTNATLGSDTLATLRAMSAVEDFHGDEAAGPAVADAELQRELARCVDEKAVVKAITPALWRLRVADNDAADGCRSVLVNSENLKWLDRPTCRWTPTVALRLTCFSRGRCLWRCVRGQRAKALATATCLAASLTSACSATAACESYTRRS